MSKDQAKTPPTEKAPSASSSSTSTTLSDSSALPAPNSTNSAETKPAVEKPSALAATPPPPQPEKLPDDRWPLNRKEPIDPTGDADLGAEQVALVDKGVAFLLASKDHWKVGIPEPLSAWTTLRELLPSGIRPLGSTDLDLSVLRQKLSDQIICRIYPGITSKERLLIIRCVGTKYSRMELIPWTRGK